MPARAATICVVLLASAAAGQEAAFVVIPGSSSWAWTAQRISGDGNTVIGFTSGLSGFRWTQATGPQVFAPPSSSSSYVVGVSDNGLVIGGAATFTGMWYPYVYRNGAFTPLNLHPGSQPMGGAVSGDGRVVAGYWFNAPWNSWRYIEGVGTLDLPSSWQPAAIDETGEVIIGTVTDPGAFFYYRASTNSWDLIVPPAGYRGAAPRDVTPDGSTVVGYFIADTINQARYAFRWRIGSGFELLSTTPWSEAHGVSEDGSVIVGCASTGVACAWTANGQLMLAPYLTSLGLSLEGQTLYQAIDVSRDGRSITGYGTTGSSWWARVPQGFGCYANCDNSPAAPALNVADFTCFLQRFAAGQSYSNCDGSTTPPVLNVADFTCFLQRFAAGCE